MAASGALLTWGGLKEEEEEGLRERLQAVEFALQAKDAALRDLQSRLQAALGEVEQGRAKEAALLRRAEIAEAAEEALASQMAELEAEAYASITQSNNMQRHVLQRAECTWIVDWEESMRTRQRVEELERRLEAAIKEAGGWERRYREVKVVAKEADEITERTPSLEQSVSSLHEKTMDRVSDGQVAAPLAEAEQALEAVHAKLEEEEEEEEEESICLAQVMSVKRKGPNEAIVSMSLQYAQFQLIAEI